MPEQTTTSSTRVYETSPPRSSSSLSLTLAWLFIIVLLLLIVTLYILFFVNWNDNSSFGAAWKSNVVSNTTTSIAPIGQSIYLVNGGVTRATDQDFLYISLPKNVPYVNRIFVIYNTSSTNQLELRPNEGVITTVDGNTIGSMFIQPLTGVTFFWYNRTSIIPIIVGVSPLQNS